MTMLSKLVYEKLLGTAAAPATCDMDQTHKQQHIATNKKKYTCMHNLRWYVQNMQAFLKTGLHAWPQSFLECGSCF